MSYETRAYERTNDDGFPPDPVVVLVATGTHDVSRLVAALSSGTCEQGDVGRRINRQLRRHNSGRAALSLLAAHGGPDLLEGEPPGYIVAGYEHGELRADWDGEVHPGLPAARKALEQCRAAGWPSWGLYALLPIDQPTSEPASTETEV